MAKPYVNKQNSLRDGTGKYPAAIAQIAKDGVCPFCPEHISKYHKNPILKEGKFWLVTDNMYPYKGAKHQALFVHKTHIEHVRELSNDAWSELLGLVQEEAERRGIAGGTFIMRFGEAAYTGASVRHLHANIVSPDADDPNREPIVARVG